ncbi:MAG: hypothetical protein ACXV98_09025 [Ilumatobacteraceae bacterium]
MTMRLLFVGVLSVVTFAGCGNSVAVSQGATTSAGSTAPIAVNSLTPVDAQRDRLPAAATVPAGGAADFELYTHCGINGIMIAGRWWQADPPLNDGQGNPPTGWGNPYQPGTLRLVDQETVVFSAHQLPAAAALLPSVTFHRTASTDYPNLCS